MVFKSQIKITGEHARIMHKYSRPTGAGSDVPFSVSDGSGNTVETYIFDTLFNCYATAAMIGIVYHSKKDPDRQQSNYQDANIFADKVMQTESQNVLKRIYQHMILSEDNDSSADGKIKQAFHVQNTDDEAKVAQAQIDAYARGGLEIMDEKFGECNSYESIANAMIDFTQEIQDFFLPESEY